jgi:hypothetical protein
MKGPQPAAKSWIQLYLRRIVSQCGPSEQVLWQDFPAKAETPPHLRKTQPGRSG